MRLSHAIVVAALSSIVLGCGGDGASGSDTAATSGSGASASTSASSTSGGSSTAGSGAASGSGGSGPSCGDGNCDPDETCRGCPEDCGRCGGCGDGECDPGETCMTCASDCGRCPSCMCNPDCSMGPECGGVVMETGTPSGVPGGSGVTPGGMGAGNFYLPSATYDSLDFFFTVETEPPAGSHYFWAHQFWFEGGDGGYTGLQSEGLIGGQWVGKMAIFSVWQTTEAMPGPGASCEPFGAEGTGMSCRKELDWIAGATYRHRIEQVTADPLWWRVLVLELGGAAEWELGRIKVPAAWAPLEPTSVSFTEYYGQVTSCTATPFARARFGPVFASHGTVPVTIITSHTYGTCASVASAQCTGAACQ